MSQLLKHYYVNIENGEFATSPNGTFVLPSVKELSVVHALEDDQNITYFLSTCPDYIRSSVTIPREKLSEYQNNQNIKIVSVTDFERKKYTFNEETATFSESEEIELVCDLVYEEKYNLNSTEGFWVITQEEWDNEILSFDSKQEKKRMNILRSIRDEILKVTDWIVVRAKEQGTNLSAEFKTWRQELRDLPSGNFPTSFPTIPTSLSNDSEIQKLYDRFDEVRVFTMINDPLPPLPSPSFG